MSGADARNARNRTEQTGKAANIRRAAPVLLALLEELRERKTAGEHAHSPARPAAPLVGQSQRGDFSEQVAS